MVSSDCHLICVLRFDVFFILLFFPPPPSCFNLFELLMLKVPPRKSWARSPPWGKGWGRNFMDAKGGGS